MKILQNIIIFLIFITICSCNNTSSNKVKKIENAKTSNSSVNVANPTDNSANVITDTKENDTTITIKFKELSITINRLQIFDENKELESIQKDTVILYAELGETIEGQLIIISNNQLTNVTVEQRYETSLTIMNEGPHCDLVDWKHFTSDWKALQSNKTGQFICDKYSEKEYEKFPEIAIDDIKQAVKEHCGEDWLPLVENLKKPTEYPCSVNLSRYYLRITGKNKNNGQTVTKLIIIELPMGC